MYERLLDKDLSPDYETLKQFCGEGGERFERLNSYLSDVCGTTLEIRFPYGNSYGWCVTHRRRKKLVCDIFVEAGAFNVMLRLTNDKLELLYPAMCEYTRDVIDHKYPCGDGGYLHYRVLTDEHLNDLFALLEAKCK